MKKYKNILNIFFISYTGISVFNLFHHEPWRDEAQAWLIARDVPLLEIHRLAPEEGTPMLWHYLLVPLAKTELPYISLNILSIAIAIATVYLLFYKLSLPLLLKIFFAFSYYMLFDYNIIARQYCLGVFFLFLIAYFYQSRFDKPIKYVLPIFLLGNTSLYAFFFSVGFTIIYFYEWVEVFIKEKRNQLTIKREKSSYKLALASIILILNLVWVVVQLYPKTGGQHQYLNTYSLSSSNSLSPFFERLNFESSAMPLEFTFRMAFRDLLPSIKLDEMMDDVSLDFSNITKYLKIFISVLMIALVYLGLFFCLLFTFFMRNYLIFSVVILSYVFYAFLSAVVHFLPFYERHQALYLSLFIACLSIVDEDKKEFLKRPNDLASRKNFLNILTKMSKPIFRLNYILLTLYFLGTVPIAFDSLLADKNHNFSGSKEMADYIKKANLHQKDYIFVSGNNTATPSGILPYFENLRIFYPYGEYGTYLKWSLWKMHQKQIYQLDILKSKSNVLLLSHYSLAEEFKSNDVDNYELLYKTRDTIKFTERLYLYKKVVHN